MLQGSGALVHLFDSIGVTEGDGSFQYSVIRELFNCLSPANMAIALNTLLPDLNWQTRELLARYMADNPHEAYAPHIVKLAGDDDRDVRNAATDALEPALRCLYPALADCWITWYSDGSNEEEDVARHLESFKNLIQDPERYKHELGKTYILQKFTPGKEYSAGAGALLAATELHDLLLNFTVDFVDAEQQRLVVHVQEKRNSEVLNWLMESAGMVLVVATRS